MGRSSCNESNSLEEDLQQKEVSCMNILLCLVVIFGSLLTLGLVMTTVFVIYLFIDSLIKGDSKEVFFCF